MPEYLKVVWHHSLPHEPTNLYSEVVGDREVRKVEVYADGRATIASESIETGDTRLSETPMPSLAEIARDPQFTPTRITGKEFEAVWLRAVRGEREDSGYFPRFCSRK